MDARADLGRRGEDLAVRRYERDGYEVVERNFTCPAGEIDIIARRAATIVFCEVKTRRTDFFGDPSEAVSRAKQARLRRLALIWLSQHRSRGLKMRFDVVSIVDDGRTSKVTRLEDAF